MVLPHFFSRNKSKDKEKDLEKKKQQTKPQQPSYPPPSSAPPPPPSPTHFDRATSLRSPPRHSPSSSAELPRRKPLPPRHKTVSHAHSHSSPSRPQFQPQPQPQPNPQSPSQPQLRPHHKSTSFPPPSSSPTSASPASSPRKSASRSAASRPSSLLAHSRSSSSVSSPHRKSNSPSFSSSRFSFSPRSSASSRYSRDPDIHPLNLPPDELRRLSAMAAARDESVNAMDIDSKSPSSARQTPSNGVNGDKTEKSPTPPPHRSSSGAAEAESFKLAGNKFFKDKNYTRAIEEFTKGVYCHLISFRMRYIYTD